jgi:geranylgeranyl pyrophosphate synthase
MPEFVAVTGTLTDVLERMRSRVDRALEDWLPRPPACPPLIAEAMRYSLFAGGKRLRPVLTLAAADAVARHRSSAGAGGRIDPSDAFEAALPAACAIEMIHTYSLVHDDLPAMDNDSLRRGRPTAHVVYGDGVAILAGDGLQAAAFELLAREPATTDAGVRARKLVVLELVARASGPAGMVGGQTIDLQACGQVTGQRLALDPAALEDMHARKTGAIIRAAAAAGAIMAQAPPELVTAVGDYAGHLGLAFQIIDDVLDVEGDAATLGKTAGKDAADDKPSYPSVFGVARSRQMAQDCVARARAALEGAGLTAGWLWPIAEWMLERRA